MHKAVALRWFSLVLLVPLLLSSCAGSSRSAVCYAMGARVSVTVYDGTLPSDIATCVSGLENRISRKIPSSLISRANGGETVALPSDVAEALALCVRLTECTGGAFDLSVGNVTALWDFDGDARLPSAGELDAALQTCGWKNHVRIDGKTLDVENSSLDLGAIGKGMACDALIGLLRGTASSGVVSVGGSVGILSENGRVYSIAIRDPFESGNGYLGILKMKSGFVSTSGTYEKYIEQDGVRYHHILDARTGMPVRNGLVSVTVVADTGVLSDALSTAAFLLGVEEGMKLCMAYGASAVFVREDGSLLVSDTLRETVSFREGMEVAYR